MLIDERPIFRFTGPLGVPVQIGGTLLILLGFYLFIGRGDWVWAVLFVIMLAVSILLHELGHAWAARRQNMPVKRIMLHAGGGFCDHADPATARQQAFIVAMGPAVNITLWILAALFADGLDAWILSEATARTDPTALFNGTRAQAAELLWLFSAVNGFLALFNLIPIQPLDGGKLLHLVLLRVSGPAPAQAIAGSIGLALSVVWFPVMLIAFGLGWWMLFFLPSVPQHWAMARGARDLST